MLGAEPDPVGSSVHTSLVSGGELPEDLNQETPTSSSRLTLEPHQPLI
jgi:hypothetical protein